MSDPNSSSSADSGTAASIPGVGNGPVAGRFVLLYGDEGYVTSWDTWAEAEAAWPIPSEYRLEDGETGRVWHGGAPYEWEAARFAEEDGHYVVRVFGGAMAESMFEFMVTNQGYCKVVGKRDRLV